MLSQALQNQIPNPRPSHTQIRAPFFLQFSPSPRVARFFNFLFPPSDSLILLLKPTFKSQPNLLAHLQTYGGHAYSPRLHPSNATGTIWHLDYRCPLPAGLPASAHKAHSLALALSPRSFHTGTVLRWI